MADSENGTAKPNPAPGGPPPNIQQLVASKRLQQAQAQVGEVVDIMRVNVEKVLERDTKIGELDRRAEDLQEGASQFQQQAVRLKHKSWWENTKMWIILGVILVVIVIIIVVSTTGVPGTNQLKERSSPENIMGDTGADFSTITPGGGPAAPEDELGRFAASPATAARATPIPVPAASTRDSSEAQ
ncbi:vesicle-associated membrane protein 2-like [Tigriopus californicus]|uniref:vesicle-associated membrane protein 2-like n=1 Tax=Tigriopus californicus TaxID=6832 RepID=UPI0027DA8658|nr:vesicle-associated membrane protein 2-like [Tigriopus californicus]XP_059091336.1 vesicle-associated membrane protein 2-like [Tigriopus californicus]XP_059091337.1 vesicle-associated membrane protein 2-like [Tigriopus californicus]XP_059091338.1 vesicle-associated membrane protein 2-like [Tigriopus californicus]|eukprot:TCALIF_10109-PA protein Name:"Similar to Syb Synaptobrevin (Drosophila melanogaster)" AED:0.34 eAED:0.56 QI:0/-1/0/1/-1/1/1/0/185